MSFTIQTPKQAAVADYEAALERAQQERANIVDRIANPKRNQARPDPGAITRADEKIAVATERLETARTAAAKEARLLPTEEHLREILNWVGPHLDGRQGEIAAASEAVIEAVAVLNSKIRARNEIITRTRSQLKNARLPETGSELDGTELGYADDRLQFAGKDHALIDPQHVGYFLAALGKVHTQVRSYNVTEFINSTIRASERITTYMAGLANR